MSRPNKARGFQAERELARKLWKNGIAVVRAPASGAGARRLFYPDIVAIYKGRVAILEVKARSSLSSLRLEPERVRRLVEFAFRAGAEVYLAVKVSGLGWRIVRLPVNPNTVTGITVSKTDIEKGYTLEQFIRLMKAGRQLVNGSDG